MSMGNDEAISVLQNRIQYPESDTYGGMCEAEYQQEAVEVAISALREKAERENPQPLTLDELQEMADTREWAWVEMNFGTVGWCKPFQKYPLSMKNVDGGYVTERDFERGFIEGAYRYPPKEGDKL